MASISKARALEIFIHELHKGVAYEGVIRGGVYVDEHIALRGGLGHTKSLGVELKRRGYTYTQDQLKAVARKFGGGARVDVWRIYPVSTLMSAINTVGITKEMSA